MLNFKSDVCCIQHHYLQNKQSQTSTFSSKVRMSVGVLSVIQRDGRPSPLSSIAW